MTTNTAAARKDAESLIDSIDRQLEKWRTWFPSEDSEVAVPRGQLLALKHFANIELQRACCREVPASRIRQSAEKLSIFGQDVIASLSLAADYDLKDVAFLAQEVGDYVAENIPLLQQAERERDATPVDEAWLRSIGFAEQDDEDEHFRIIRKLQVSVCVDDLKGCCSWCMRGQEIFETFHARGSVIKLLSALNIPIPSIKETAE